VPAARRKRDAPVLQTLGSSVATFFVLVLFLVLTILIVVFIVVKDWQSQFSCCP
jgi:hypothetical protein